VDEFKPLSLNMFHLHISFLSKSRYGSAAKSLAYIARLGPFKKNKDRVRETISVMPSWAEGKQAVKYWALADSKSRANARMAYIVVAALPKALMPWQQSQLALEFADELSRLSAEGLTPHACVPYSLAIHEGYGRNPHFHLLLSASIDDQVKRLPDRWFRRYNRKNPSQGGSKRSRFMTRTPWLIEARKLWAHLANKALTSVGLPATLDHRSNAARNIAAPPGVHLGPAASYLISQNRMSPKVARSVALKKKYDVMQHLLESIDTRRQKVSWMEMEQALQEEQRRKWSASNQTEWVEILDEHPLAMDAKVARGAASIVVLQSNAGIIQSMHRLGLDQRQADVLSAVGTDWDWVQTQAGFWLVTPQSNEVIFLDVAVSTDATTTVGIRAALAAAQSRADHDPVVWAKSSVLAVVAEGMARLALKWPIKVLRDGAKHPLPKSS